MNGNRAFERRVRFGYAATLLIAVLIGIVSIVSLRSVVSRRDMLAEQFVTQTLIAEKLVSEFQTEVAAKRGYFLTGDTALWNKAERAHLEFETLLARLAGMVITERGRKLIEAIEVAQRGYHRVVESTLEEMVSKPGPRDGHDFELRTSRATESLRSAIQAFAEHAERHLAGATARSAQVISAVSWISGLISLVCIVAASFFALFLSRTIIRLYREAQAELAERRVAEARWKQSEERLRESE